MEYTYKHDIKVQEVDLPEILRRRCDDHIEKLQAVKEKLAQGSGPVYTDLYDISDQIAESARRAL